MRIPDRTQSWDRNNNKQQNRCTNEANFNQWVPVSLCRERTCIIFLFAEFEHRNQVERTH